MQRIIAPLQFGDSSPAVANLQDALQLFLDRKVFLANDADTRRELSSILRRERAEQSYQDATQKLVSIFQEEQQIQSQREFGNVDERTADAMNQLLEQQGIFEQPHPTADRSRVVSGRILRTDNQPFARAIVRAFHEAEQGLIRLGEDTTDAEGRYTIRYELLPDLDTINLRVSVLDAAGETAQSSEVVRAAQALEIIDLVISFISPATATRQVEGRIVFDHGIPAIGLPLRLYHLGFGGAEGATLLKETTTQEHGIYNLTYDIDRPANLEVRALDAAGQEIVLSQLVKNAAEKEILNLVTPATAQPLTAEFTRLTRDLQPHIGDLSRLATARETTDQQDLTLLHEASGWDARLIALAATATKLSAANEVGLSQDTLYGLLRAGLPSDKLQLARVSNAAFEQALNKARSSGIISLDDGQVTGIKQAFEEFSINTRLSIQAPGSNATYGELLSQITLNETTQKEFAKLYLNHRGDAKSLWEQATERGLGDVVPQLQKQGKLAFLTTNNPDLMANVQSALGSAGPEQLVQLGLYQKEAWLERITTIPSAYGDAPNPREAYAEDLARKIRISYSTEVTWHMIQTGEMTVEGGNANLSTFLQNAIAKGFKLGETQIDAFVTANPDVFGIAANAQDKATTTEMVKTLQRVYQITPGNDAMKALLDAGLLSAQDVTAYPLDVFLDRFGERFPSIEQAQLIYRKAEQVSNLTYSLFSLAKELDNAPPVHALSASSQVRQESKTKLIEHFPTMESLFGSLDYCECEHCRSVLSPAAYLVDLFQFLDREPKIWANTLQDWQKKHGGSPYPFKNVEAFNTFTAKWTISHPGELAPNTTRTPYEILIERRPDLPHIQLTCENTNTALPQIDLVNEILEYYVANSALTADAARDTGDAVTAELLAEPTYAIAEAYSALQQTRYPLTLPFDLWIETTRQFCNYFEVPLWHLLETFRQQDDLFVPAAVYDRATIFLEYLGLSPTEIALYTDPDPLPKWYELYGFASEADAFTEAVNADSGQRIDLNSAKALSRRLGVTYKELVEIIRAGFINSALEVLVTLRKLGIETTDVFFYQQYKILLSLDEQTLSPEDQERLVEIKAFEWRLDQATATYQTSAPGFNARTWLQDALQNNALDTVLVLAEPEAGGGFDKTTLRYANGNKVDAIALLKINLFVRLWRTLGWSIEECDRALQAFVPKNAPFVPGNLNKTPLKTALIYLAHLKTLETQLQLGKDARLKLLTLWTPLPTTGKHPLYAQLFLKRNILKSDPIFDHPLGQYLSDASIFLRNHLLALQGALGLTTDEIRRILQDDGKDIETAPLLLDTVSLLYRYGLLAKALRLSIADLVALKQMSGIDPFRPLSDEPLTELLEDHPFTQTLRFVEIAEQIKHSELNVPDLDYWLRHQFDPDGKYRLNTEAMLALTKTLANGIDAIRREHAVPADSSALSDEMLRQKLGLILPSPVVERFWAMLTGTAEFTVTSTGVAASDQLQASSFMGERAIAQITYNAPRQEQKLVFRGVLFDAQKTPLKAKFAAALSPGQQAVFAALLEAVQDQANQFFNQYLKEQPLNASVTAGFFKATDFDILFEPIPIIPDELTDVQKQSAIQINENKIREKRSRLATTFLPFLQRQLIRQFIVQTMAAATGSDAAFIESLLNDPALLSDPTQNTQSLLNAFTATAERGLSTTFFASADGTGAPSLNVMLIDANTALKDSAGSALKPPGSNSARIEGYLEVPTAGAYRFFATLSKQNAEADLRFAHLPNPVFAGKATKDNDELGIGANEFVELKPGVSYRFTLELRQLNGGDAYLQVQGETLSKDRLGRLPLYAETSVERSRRAQVLLAKVLQLIQVMGLNEREIRYILSHAADFDNLSFSQLPTRSEDNTPAQSITLFNQFLRLADYTQLKRELLDGGDELIDVFAATTLDDAYARIARIMRRGRNDVQATAEAVFLAPNFVNEITVQRLWKALQIVETFGVPVTAIPNWIKIVKAATTADEHQERAAIAQDIKATIKARFEPETWQRVAQPIFDKLRQHQRDALVAHVMHQHRFDRIEQLFEYFLIDPGAEPVVRTSRIRSAIAAVQIFIHRCLLNLEPQVAPSAIHSKQWQWMKRYPVWAGNRKLWLFPENVLEPEFRDDKTHLFQELEGALLQGDVSNDLVEDAFFTYLKKLDKLARLDIVGMYCEENALDPASNQLHVIGRSYSDPPEYFYRRFAHQMWTPWEPMSVEIQGDHIVPVMWRDRLNLFWVTFMDKGDPNAAASDKIWVKEAASEASFSASVSASEQLITSKSAQATANSTSSRSNYTPPPKVAEMTLGKLAGELRSAMVTKLVTVELHWSEYFQGKWSVRESGGDNATLTARVPLNFERTSVFIHATKEYENGEERAVKIHLGRDINQAFRIVSRNSRPQCVSREVPPPMPYNAPRIKANRHEGDGPFKVTFIQRIRTEKGKPAELTQSTPSILQQGNQFTLLPCANQITLGTAEIASLVTPLFYQDSQGNTFFVEPSFKEKTIEEWQEWITRTPEPEVTWDLPEWWKTIPLKPIQPKYKFPIVVNPGDPIWQTRIDPRARFSIENKQDWLANPMTTVQFEGELIGPRGKTDLVVQSALAVTNSQAVSQAVSQTNSLTVAIAINTGSAISAESTVITRDSNALVAAELIQATSGLNVIGSNGLNSALLKNINSFQR